MGTGVNSGVGVAIIMGEKVNSGLLSGVGVGVVSSTGDDTGAHAVNEMTNTTASINFIDLIFCTFVLFTNHSVKFVFVYYSNA